MLKSWPTEKGKENVRKEKKMFHLEKKFCFTMKSMIRTFFVELEILFCPRDCNKVPHVVMAFGYILPSIESVRLLSFELEDLVAIDSAVFLSYWNTKFRSEKSR